MIYCLVIVYLIMISIVYFGLSVFQDVKSDIFIMFSVIIYLWTTDNVDNDSNES